MAPLTNTSSSSGTGDWRSAHDTWIISPNSAEINEVLPLPTKPITPIKAPGWMVN
jgi:hypothetical protein